MADFVKLCEVILDKNGCICYTDVIDCGFDVNHFNKLSQASPEKLMKNAIRALADRNIYYKQYRCNGIA